jgi:hypothetical protein
MKPLQLINAAEVNKSKCNHLHILASLYSPTMQYRSTAYLLLEGRNNQLILNWTKLQIKFN